MSPDISLCQNDKCLRQDNCLRHVAKPDSAWQSYALFDGGEDCNGYIPIQWPEEGELPGIPASE